MRIRIDNKKAREAILAAVRAALEVNEPSESSRRALEDFADGALTLDARWFDTDAARTSTLDWVALILSPLQYTLRTHRGRASIIRVLDQLAARKHARR